MLIYYYCSFWLIQKNKKRKGKMKFLKNLIDKILKNLLKEGKQPVTSKTKIIIITTYLMLGPGALLFGFTCLSNDDAITLGLYSVGLLIMLFVMQITWAFCLAYLDSKK